MEAAAAAKVAAAAKLALQKMKKRNLPASLARFALKIAMAREEETHTLTLETPLLRKVEDTPFDRGSKKEGSKKKSK